MSDVLLSLCMIVKNEAEFIGRCLSSVRHAVDEIIVVDTGSEDQTIELAKANGAKVYEHKWTGSFAEARNESISKAKGEWILWMDADEMLEESDAAILREGVLASKKDILLVQLLNYFGEKEPREHQMYTINHHRLFRNHKGFLFVNSIHEQLHVEGETYDQSRIGLLPVRIHHFGYLEEVVRKKGKFDRNMKMLKEQINAGDSQPWMNYHIASEYYRIGRYADAFKYTNKAILQFLSSGQLPPSMLYHMRYSILISTGSFESACQGIEKVIQLYPDYVDLHFYRGIILYKLNRYAEALDSFRHCIEMGDKTTSHLSKKGTGSFYAYYYMGLVFEAFEAYSRAEDAYQQAIKQYPDFKEAHERLELIRPLNRKGVN